MDDREPALTIQDWISLRSWFEVHGRHDLPWRIEPSPWGILLAEVLLHRTRAMAAERVYREVVRQFPNPADIVSRPTEWLEMTHPAGLAWRAKTFISACEQILTSHDREVPSARDALMSLPGVGHYIASAVRCFGFGIPEVLVDTNTIRLASRITDEPLSPARHRSRKVRESVERITENCIAASPDDNYALLDLAAIVCHSRSPECVRCPVLSACGTGHRLLAEIPSLGRRF